MARKSRNAEEYRQAAAIRMGRVLRPGEVVHHINLDHTDNRPENMHVCTSEKHQKAHASASTLIKELLKAGVIKFDEETSTYLPDDSLGIVMPMVVYVEDLTPRESMVIIKRAIHNGGKGRREGCPAQYVLEASNDRGLTEERTMTLLRRLSQNGEVYSPMPGTYKLAEEG